MEGAQWGEFRIGDLFRKLDLKFRKPVFDKSADLSRVRTEEFSLPLVNAKNGNNGIMYYGRPEDFEYESMTIDIVGDGQVSTGNVYAQPHATGVLYNAYLVKPSRPVSQRALLFFAAAIEKAIKHKYGYQNKAVWSKVQDDLIHLPVCNEGIHFELIDRIIAELEARHVAELEAYLSSAGLSDCTLTDGDYEVLAMLDSLDWVTFNLKELFGPATRGKRLKSADRTRGTLPFVTAGEAETGVSAFIGNKVEIFPAGSFTIDMFGSAKFRNYAYGGDDHVAVVHTESLTRNAAIFVASAAHKAAHTGEFDYGRNFYAKDANALNVSLPAKNGKPDWELMDAVVSATHKLVVQNLADFASREIEASRKVAGLDTD